MRYKAQQHTLVCIFTMPENSDVKRCGKVRVQSKLPNMLLFTVFDPRPRLAPVFLFVNMFLLSIYAETRKSERDAFTLRLKLDHLQFVKEMAEEENRSIPNFVETVLIGEQRRRQAQAGSNAKKE